MILEDRFYGAVGKWMEHCGDSKVQLSSRSDDVIECDAFREIVALGRETFPLIRKLYDQGIPGSKEREKEFAFEILRGHGLVRLVGEIAGSDFSIPEEMRGNVPQMEAYTMRWLDQR